MGVFLWHQWARLVSLSACIYLVWAGIWGLFWRKFFWDFVGSPGFDKIDTATSIPAGSFLTCTLNCGGHILVPAAKPFVAVIVNIPLLQIFMILLGVFTTCLEYPIKPLQGLSIQRNFVFKAVLLIVQATIGILVYQGTNGAIWALIAAFAYGRAALKGEITEEQKAQMGKAGGRA